ncbi:MAG TPA: thermonuclease family protein [Steroidobacteraceae bacterium]|jgi:endonuclease YncB( thermonuclease family)
MSRTVAAIALLCFGLAAAGEARAPRFNPAHPPRAGDEGVFYGPLVRVKDGDSLVAKIQGVAMEIRLAEIDAPELEQPYGHSAKQELAALAAGRQLVILPLDTDRYGRTVAHVWNGDTHLNAELVKRGAAWFYSEYARTEALYYDEQEARDAKRGLWALPLRDRIEPWTWRERARRRN